MLAAVEEETYSPSEAARVLSRSGRSISERRVRQMLQAGELEGEQTEGGRWRIPRREVNRLLSERRERDELRREPESPPEAPESVRKLMARGRELLSRELGRSEARLELTEQAESTTPEERDRLLAELEAEREERRRLVERLEAEQRRGFWSRTVWQLESQSQRTAKALKLSRVTSTTGKNGKKMLWLEMSRDEVHGGGSWAFGQSLWSPSHKTNNTRWAFWETLLRVEAGDPVLHLRGKGEDAAFVAFSKAAANGFETSEQPPNPGEWGYAQTFYRVPLRDFTPFADRIFLQDVFAKHDSELRSYFIHNKAAAKKERLFYVIQGGRLQCLNGAYLSEASADLARLILDAPEHPPQSPLSVVKKASTGERLRELVTRVGQREFSKQVQENYAGRCCFPGCDVEEQTFLRGSHIARWADAPEIRGDISNGLCLCLMHDQAFESGLFTIDLDTRIWVDADKASKSPWATVHLIPHHGHNLKSGKIPPSEEALLKHWERVGCYPE